MKDKNSSYLQKSEIKEMFKTFPFKSYLSFEPLIEFWEKETSHPNPLKSEFAKSLVEKAKQVPELINPQKDSSFVEKHKDIIDMLMAIVYPQTRWETEVSASGIPFGFDFFYRTAKFKNIIPLDGAIRVEKLGLDEKAIFIDKVVNAYILILNQLYNINFNIKSPLVIKTKNNQNGLNRYFQLNVDTGFVKAVCKDKLPDLNKEALNKALKDVYNIELWTNLLPPEKFEFHGFVTFTANDVTEQEILSAIKFDLLEKSTIMSLDHFYELQDKIRSLFMLPDLRIGLAAVPDDWENSNSQRWKIGESFVLNEQCELECTDMTESIYSVAFKTGKPFHVGDLETYEHKGKVEEEILKLGIRNILVAPLYFNNRIIGVLEIGSPNPCDITSMNLAIVKSILPLFATAVKRNAEEFENEIQKIIKEKCTTIHPSVEWRFRQSAANLIVNKEQNKLAEMEPIVFDNVYPLYGLSDIRNSSEYRNDAVRSDLIGHLNLAKGVLSSATGIKKMPLFDEQIFRIEKNIKRVDEGLSSGDEVEILEFLQNEIEPVFNHISDYDSSLRDLIVEYKSSLDANHKTLYLKRKQYDESVRMINETVSSYLDECDEEAQAMYPHYFEKYKTDGVEHGVYIGQSLVENKKFDQIYLRNMRLWQLMVMCGVIQKLGEVKTKLAIPLETSHLILVQNTPMSITFRFDEKKFDVAGTYNLRYEIMKKRIDKVLIKGTKERLTQPGKIAIVYSQAREASEYKRYIEYLESLSDTECKMEEFELEDLQGVLGLRALRFTVNLDTDALQKKMNFKEISGTVKSLQEILN